ncbi:MAG TPA: membrane protein insertase YidC, partial [Woeseiaceae bacterium]|nr:membrane protein insertase YidC [Woeseiaceae bacterium]
MDNQRLLVWATFGLLAWFTYQAWVQDYGPQPAPPQPQPAATQAAAPEPGGAAADTDDGLPPLDDSALDTPAAVPADDSSAPAAAAASTDGDAVIHVVTDVYDIDISTRGGTLQKARILKYPVEKDRPEEVVTLLSPKEAQLGLVQTGLRSRGDGPEANQNALFRAAAGEYTLQGDELVVPLRWTDGAGVTVEKRFRFTRGSYRIEVEQVVRNDAAAAWQGAEYAQIRRRNHHGERSMFDVDSYSYDGPVIYDGEKSEKLKHDDLLKEGPFQLSATGGWFALIQH